MSDEIAAEFELNNVELDAEFELTNEDNIDATFEIYASGTVWGNIDGNIENQTDLAEALNSKQDVLTAGDNITIEDNVISATDTTYTAGNGISIENNVISNTQTSAEWGNIEGNLSDQTDLKDALDTLDGAIDSNHREITNINNTIQNYGDIVSYDAADFATKNQGELADTSLQPGDNITELTNNAGFITGITSSDVTTALGYTPYNSTNPNGYITSSALNGYATESFVTNQGYITGIDGQDVTEALGYTPYNSTNPNGYISGIDSADVTNALGYTPYDDSNPDGYITSADLPTVNNSTITIQKNGSAVESFNLNQSNNETINITVPTQASDVNAVPTTRTVNGKSLNTNITLNASDVGALSDTTTINDLTTQAQQDALNSGATVTNIGQIASNTQAITLETTNRQNADNNLQSQIDAIVSSSDVFDIVGTYAELQAYDISTVPVNDIIKVLVDSTHSNAATYYRCVENNNVKSWSYIGSEGAYYTKSEADGRFVSQTTTVNGQALSSNITLDAQDVGALPNSTVIPTATSDLTNDSGYITSSDLQEALNDKQDILTAGTDLEIVEGSILPNTYTQLTSITSTGTQWINSGIKLTNNFKSIIVGRLAGTPTSNFRTILGANDNSLSQGKQNVLLGWGNSSNGFYAEPCLFPSYTYSSYPWDTNTHTFTTNVTPTVTTLDVDGVVDTISSAPSITGVNLAIFARLAQDNTVGSQVNFELNSIELYQSGNLVFKGVPAKRNSDDEVGLYDTVSGSFFSNSGTGDFVAGNEVSAITVINFTNDTGYITGIDNTDVTTALGYTPVNPSTLSTVATSGSYTDLSNRPTIPTVNNKTITLKLNNRTVDTFTTNQSTNKTINFELQSADVTEALSYTPYDNSNPRGFITGITSSDVTTALGYTPYNSTNPNGYTSNVGTVTSVNNTQPDSNGNVSLTIPDTTNFVTTNTAQDISGKKTFLGEKAIYFKQNATTNKLGFTLYNPSDTELGALEYRPNTINGSALFNLNTAYSNSCYLGFRYWGASNTTTNIIAPKKNGNFYIPIEITDGTNTATADNTGTLDITTIMDEYTSAEIQTLWGSI